MRRVRRFFKTVLCVCAGIRGVPLRRKGNQKPVFTILGPSAFMKKPRVKVHPLRLSGVPGQNNKIKKYNVFQFGVDTEIELTAELKLPLLSAATAQVWFSSLSLGRAARIAANQYLPTVNVCSELAKLPRNAKLPRDCPIAAGTVVPFKTHIGRDLWSSIENWRDTVMGATGVLELRLLDGPPCTVCFTKPGLLLGVTLPFSIEGPEVDPLGARREPRHNAEL